MSTYEDARFPEMEHPILDQVFLNVQLGKYDESFGEILDSYTLPEEVLHPGMKILDAGCGVGLFSYIIAKKYPKITSIRGIDKNKLFIELARHEMRDIKLTFDLGDICKPDEYKGAYDLVILDNVVHHLEHNDAIKAFENFYQSLREGGNILIRDFDRTYSNIQTNSLLRYWRTLRELKGDKYPYMVLKNRLGIPDFGMISQGEALIFDSMLAAYSETEITSALESTGFKVVSLQRGQEVLDARDVCLQIIAEKN